MGISYRQIQFNLKIKYGTGMSNSTLQNLYDEAMLEMERDDRIKQLENELAMFKRMYFEVLNKLQEVMNEHGLN